jgi:hypothetical protein
MWSLLETNRDYITANYCINKSSPEMHCEGSCFIAQKMQETSHSDNSFSFFLQDFSEIISILPFESRNNNIVFSLENNYHPWYVFNYQLLTTYSFFHPPLI